MRSIALFLTGLAALCVLPGRAAAQGTSDTEQAGHSRGGYAWGEGPAGAESEGEGAAAPSSYRRFGYVFAMVGVGGTVRTLVHADVCDPGVSAGCRFSPAYLQLRGGWLFETDAAYQHGVGLGIATNLASDGLTSLGIDPGGQWTLAPAYHFRYWLDEWFQIMGHVGVPFSFSALTTATGASLGSTVNWGLELQATFIVKFLQGIGVYAALGGALYFGTAAQVWPTVSLEGGLVFDYEVLP